MRKGGGVVTLPTVVRSRLPRVVPRDVIPRYDFGLAGPGSGLTTSAPDPAIVDA
jgi:hypothetical protein